jgi:hypothetical protein
MILGLKAIVKKPDKCRTCYFIDDCMLTATMRKLCGGPFKDVAARIDFMRKLGDYD